MFDIVLAEKVFSEGNFALTLNNDTCHIVEASQKLNSKIIDISKEVNIPLVLGNTVCTDCFDVYMTNVNEFLARIPQDFNPVSAEMEAFALFYVAKMLHKNASCLMSVVDSKYIKEIASPKERETGLDNMIKLALETTIKI